MKTKLEFTSRQFDLTFDVVVFVRYYFEPAYTNGLPEYCYPETEEFDWDLVSVHYGGEEVTNDKQLSIIESELDKEDEEILEAYNKMIKDLF